MNTNKNSKKIVILGLILLVIAGLIVVSLKGFNVSLLFGKHETIELKVGKEIDMQKLKEVCATTFQDKKYIAKELEVFGDSFQINVKSITDDEKENLIAGINEKFETEKTVEDLNVNSVSNKRIRDEVRPYFAPMLIVFAIVSIYAWIRFRKINSGKVVLNFIWKIILTEMILLSIIAIARIPVNDLVIDLIMMVAILQLIYFMGKGERKLEQYVQLDDKEEQKIS